MIHTAKQLKEDGGMEQMWEQFRKKKYYVEDLRWGNVISYVIYCFSEAASVAFICDST